MNLKRQLISAFGKTLPQCKINIIFKSNNRLSSLFSFKDIIPNNLRSNLVYKFSCGDCNVTYYGKTERHLKVRASEHLGFTPLTGKRVTNLKPSAISDHLLLTGHHGDYDNFTVLSHDANGFKLLIKESILISRDSPILNKNISSIPGLIDPQSSLELNDKPNNQNDDFSSKTAL